MQESVFPYNITFHIIVK